MLRVTRSALVLPLVLVAAVSGSAAAATRDTAPPGDIPDNQAYVVYTPPGGGFSVKVPEGWSRTRVANGVVFSSKLNSIGVESTTHARKPTTATARSVDVPALRKANRKFHLDGIATVKRHAGTAVVIRYRAMSKPDAVTGRSRENAVERYSFFHAGRVVALTLSGPRGADNVDPWRIVSDSLRWRR